MRLLKRAQVQYQKDEKNTSCLHIAIMRGHAEIVKFLLKKTEKNLNADISPANDPALKGLNDIEKKKAMAKKTKELRQNNLAQAWEAFIDVDEQRINDGLSTVFFAIRSASIECLKALRLKGANFNLECMSDSNQRMRPI